MCGTKWHCTCWIISLSYKGTFFIILNDVPFIYIIYIYFHLENKYFLLILSTQYIKIDPTLIIFSIIVDIVNSIHGDRSDFYLFLVSLHVEHVKMP